MPLKLKKNRDYKLLTYAGTLPLFIALILEIILPRDFADYLKLPELVSKYSYMIIIFMCGTYWGVALEPSKHSKDIFILSNIYALIAFFCFLWLPERFLLHVAFSFFVILFFTDRKLRKKRMISRHYYHTRFNVTLLVLTALGSYIYLAF